VNAAAENPVAQWMGEPPGDWETIRLKNLFRIRKQIAGRLGFDVLAVTQRGVKLKDIGSGGGQLSMDYSKYQVVRVGDFVMNHMDLLTGYIDISKYPGVTSPDYRVFVPWDSSAICPRYFLHVFQLCYHGKVFFPLGQGSAQLGRWRLPRQAFEDFPLPVPPLPTQRVIANFLDRKTAAIDALIQKKERLIELLAEKRQALITQAVTNGLDPNVPMKDSAVDWLGKVPKHWSVSRLKRLCSQVRDGTHTPPPRVDGTDYRLLSARNIQDDEFILRDDDRTMTEDAFAELERSYTVRPGDIALAVVGATTGKSAIVGDVTHVSVQRSVAVLRPHSARTSASYMHYLLQSGGVQHEIAVVASKYAAQGGIYLEEVANLSTPLPPMNEQDAILTYLRKRLSPLGAALRKLRDSSELLRDYRQALISAAVTGKFEVSEERT